MKQYKKERTNSSKTAFAVRVKIVLISFLFFMSFTAGAFSENDSTAIRWEGMKDHTTGILKSFAVGIEYRVKAGVAIGGTLPLPFPLEIRKIDGYTPLFNTSLEAEFVKMFRYPFGMSFGLRLETKGMKTTAEVKNYGMRMFSPDGDGGEISGVWTGMVETNVDNSYLTLPVLALWKPHKRWDVKFGAYVSYVLSREFSGYVYDGYLRENSPVGQKIEIAKTPYDFSNDIRRWGWGLQTSADWRAFPHLLVGVDLTWGANSIFKKDFDVITSNMYPVFLRFNFGYAF